MNVRAVVGMLLLAGLLVFAAVWTSGDGHVPLVTSEGDTPQGMRGAVVAAEALGVAATGWKRPLVELVDAHADGSGHRVLVLTLPVQKRIDSDDGAALHAWMVAGNTLVVQTNGQAVDPMVMDSLSPLHLSFRTVPELGGSIADRAALAVWLPVDADGPPVAARPPELVAVDHADDVLLYGDRSSGTVRERSVGRGKLVVIDGLALSNRWLARSQGNSALWTSLVDGADGVWLDDYHQGLLTLDLLARDTPRWPFHLLLAHLALLWSLGLWAIARPFGSRSGGGSPRRSSVARELRELAQLHAHHDHSAGATASLRAHVGALPPGESDHPDDLLELARRVAALQRAGRLT